VSGLVEWKGNNRVMRLVYYAFVRPNDVESLEKLDLKQVIDSFQILLDVVVGIIGKQPTVRLELA